MKIPKYNEKLKIVDDKEDVEVKPCKIIIIQGHLIYTHPEFLHFLDLKIYIDTDDDVRLSRRIMKFIKHKESEQFQVSISIEDLLDKYEKIIKPRFELWIEPTKKLADIIIPNYAF